MDANFKKMLFKTAFCCMACDGHIDPEEIEELKLIDKKTAYFSDIDLSNELDDLVHALQTSGTKFIEELFQELRKTKLNPIQELLILEVALRIIHADNRLDENEMRFLRFLRGKLEISDELIKERFGNNNLLLKRNHIEEVDFSQTTLRRSFNIPEIESLKKIKDSFGDPKE